MNINEFDVNKILINGVPEGKDPDKYSKLLKEYHICLWSSRKVKKCKFILKKGRHILKLFIIIIQMNIQIVKDYVCLKMVLTSQNNVLMTKELV